MAFGFDSVDVMNSWSSWSEGHGGTSVTQRNVGMRDLIIL